MNSCRRLRDGVVVLIRGIAIALLGGVWGSVSLAQWDLPYNENEEGKLRAFLQCASMVPGQTNAELLGVDPDDPDTWSGVSWIETDPLGSPHEPLDSKRVLHIDLRGTFAGSIDFSGFDYMETCSVDNSVGTIVNRGIYSSINITGNGRLKSISLRHVDASAIVIGGTPELRTLRIATSAAGVLNVSAPTIVTLETSTLGISPTSLAGFPLLETLALTEIDNVTSLDLGVCPALKYFFATYMDGLQQIQLGGLSQLLSATLSDNDAMVSVDIRGLPELASFYCSDNLNLASVQVGGNPKLAYVEMHQNASLTSLALSDLPSLEGVRCSGNPALQTLEARNDPVLDFVLCTGNALTTLDVSGSTALETLMATGNQLRRFVAPGLEFKHLSLNLNPLEEITVNIAGSPVHLLSYAYAGYVGLYAFPDPENSSKTILSMSCEELPEPRNTKLLEVRGTGFPGGDDWDEHIELGGAVDATFVFGAGVLFMSYYERVEDNPLGEWLGLAHFLLPVVGDPIGPVTPPERAGYTLAGWYTDEDLTQEWDLETDILYGEMTLWPRWVSEDAPVISSIDRLSPAGEYTRETCVTFRVTFSDIVSGVDPSDFVVTATGTAAGNVTAVSGGSGESVDVTVCVSAGSGTLRLDVKETGTGIADGEGNGLYGGYDSGETYTVGAAGALGEFLLGRGIDPASPGGAPDADFDRDGLSNLLEYVLGRDPAGGDGGPAPTAKRISDAGTQMLEFGYSCTDAADAVFEVVVEYSDDMIGWTPAVDGQEGVSISSVPSGDGEFVTAQIPAPGPGLFARLRVQPR